MEWSADVFHSTLLKVLEKKTLSDMTDDGIINYIFMAFKINTLREQQYPYVARRIPMDCPPDRADTDRDDLQARIERDALSDYMADRLLRIVEQNFDADHFNAFRLKHMTDMTYKELIAKTGIAKARQYVKEVREWLAENIDKGQLAEGFYSQP